jgi:hypothetical protein
MDRETVQAYILLVALLFAAFLLGVAVGWTARA